MRKLFRGYNFCQKQFKIETTICKILVLGILPRRGIKKKGLFNWNKSIAIIPTGKNIKFAGAENILLNKDKKIDESLFQMGCINAGGYERLGSFIVNQLANHKIN